MGLTIHYSGSFNPSASLKAMIDEVKDIAEIYKWEYFIFNEEFPPNSLGKTKYNKNIYGICFTPPNCETVSLCFLSNGKMSSFSSLKFWGEAKNKTEASYLYFLFTKTQHAGAETHKLIIHLLKYISKKYLQDFTTIDEGKYWETGDEKLLEDTFKQYTDMINGFSSSIENYPIQPGESIDDYFKRLLKQLREKNKK